MFVEASGTVTTPGWYPDPLDWRYERYWDGGLWTPSPRQ
jgi:hypothetical protein